MATYKVVVKPSVEKDIRPIPVRVIEKIFKKIDELKTNPYPKQSVKISGSKRQFRLRVSDYRIIYEVDNQSNLIIIHYIRHRRDAYKSF
jgi:mRNA interferase RelE/StbE